MRELEARCGWAQEGDTKLTSRRLGSLVSHWLSPSDQKNLLQHRKSHQATLNLIKPTPCFSPSSSFLRHRQSCPLWTTRRPRPPPTTARTNPRFQKSTSEPRPSHSRTPHRHKRNGPSSSSRCSPSKRRESPRRLRSRRSRRRWRCLLGRRGGTGDRCRGAGGRRRCRDVRRRRLSDARRKQRGR